MRYDELRAKGNICEICGKEILPDSKKHYRKGFCSSCVDLYLLERRNYFKVKAINYLGGKCSKCNRIVCLSAFDFHHYSNDKENSIGYLVSLGNWNRLQLELDWFAPS